MREIHFSEKYDEMLSILSTGLKCQPSISGFSSLVIEDVRRIKGFCDSKILDFQELQKIVISYIRSFPSIDYSQSIYKQFTDLQCKNKGYETSDFSYTSSELNRVNSCEYKFIDLDLGLKFDYLKYLICKFVNPDIKVFELFSTNSDWLNEIPSYYNISIVDYHLIKSEIINLISDNELGVENASIYADNYNVTMIDDMLSEF
ncbi:hypothetical protein AB4345_08270 [Vibrio breoganii]